MTGFAVGDITVGNGAASAFDATSAPVYTALITPASDGAVTVDVAANVATDTATNPNTAATQATSTFDGSAPTVAITGVPASSTAAFTATFTFSEDVTGFAVGDITVGNGAASAFDATSAPVYTALITPASDGAVTVDVAANVATDTATNPNTAATQATSTFDTTAPTVAITGVPASSTAAFTATFTFSEDVTGFAVGDITVGNGAASAFDATSAPVYTALITPASDGAVTVDVAANVATDTATNPNTAATQATSTFDGTAPTVAITGVPASSTTAFTATFTFSEDVTGFAVGDITVGNGAASAFDATSAPVYTALITPASDGAVTVDVAANVATDTATNPNTAATQATSTFDGTAPTVAITGPSAAVVGPFDVTLAFSENVTGLVVGDIVVANGTVTNFTSSGNNYVITINPTLGQTVTVDVAANVAQDAAGNGNEASNTFSVVAGSPATEFEANKTAIQSVIENEVKRSLQNTVASNTRMSRDARTRFIESQRQVRGQNGFALATQNYVDGFARVTELGFVSKGDFLSQSANFDGTSRRLIFGDFDIQRDADGSVTSTINAKVAWEYNISDTAMLGYYIGGELGRSNLDGSFKGDQNQYGITAGAYAAVELHKNLYFDGFASIGIARNSLKMNNGTLSLESDYTTRNATMGGAVTGVIEQKGFELWPQIAFTYGHTWVGDVPFTGAAYGLIDNTLSLHAGTVSVANLTFRPEFRIPTGTDSHSMVTAAPRLICERVKATTTTDDCGYGAELGFSTKSANELTSFTAQVSYDKVSESTRTGIQLKLNHSF